MTRPLWDVVADFTAGPPSTPGISAVSLNSVAGTRSQAWDSRRGRQYELGEAEAGTLTLNMFDRAENLNPINGASPWNSGSNSILPYRCIQVGALWNPAALNTSGNILNAANSPPGTPPGGSTVYDPSFETSGATAWIGNFGTSATVAQSTTQAFDGTHSLAVTLTAAADKVGAGLWTVPGCTYTMSAYVFVPSGYQVSLTFGQFSPAITTYGTATSSTTGAWQRLAVTSAATNAVSYFTVRQASGAPFPFTCYLDACQLELAASASAFSTSGPVRSARYTGYIERYPQTWVDAGFRGVKPLEAVDALSALSRTVINQSYQATILVDKPTLYIPYNDQSLPQVVQMPQGGQPSIGYSNLGTNGSVNFQGDTFPDGSPAVTVTQQNANPTISGNTSYITYSGTHSTNVSVNTSAATLEMWIKPSSGTVYAGAASVPLTESVNTEAAGPSHYFGIYTAAGKIQGNYSDPNGHSGGGFGFPGAWSGYPDGQWHYLALVFPGGNNVHYFADGVAGGVGGLGFTPTPTVGMNNFFVDSTTYFGDPVTSASIANIAFYPAVLSDARLLAHYNRGIGYLGEVSGARVARLLGAYWSATNYSAAPGIIQLAPDFNYDPVGSPQSARTMLDVLQEISTTENGFIWANVAGKVIWEDRSTRVAQQTAIATLGQGAGQIHYEDIEYDYDATYVYSQVNLTRPDNSNYAPQVNNTSLANYGQRILSATLQVNSDYDLGQAALFYLARYAVPGGAPGTSAGPRIRKLVLNPAADPTMWTFVLGLDLSQRITVAFKTSTGLLVSYDYYVENIAESHDPAQGAHTVELQVSPVFVPTAGILGDATYGVLGSTTYVVY